MARFRRKMWITLLLFLLFVFGVMMGLKALRPEGAGFIDGVGLELLPQIRHRAAVNNRKANTPSTERSAESGPLPGNSNMDGRQHATLSPMSDEKRDQLPAVNYDLHAFYYSWYGNQQIDGKYIHWNHPLVPHWDPKIASSYPKGRHNPPDDISSNFYPELGPYSSRDPAVLDEHMRQFRAAAIGVLALSWYPPGLSDDNGEPTDDLVPAILEAAHKYQLKVTFHIEPYEGREHTFHRNLKYIIHKLPPVTLKLVSNRASGEWRGMDPTLHFIDTKLTRENPFRCSTFMIRISLAQDLGPTFSLLQDRVQFETLNTTHCSLPLLSKNNTKMKFYRVDLMACTHTLQQMDSLMVPLIKTGKQ
ncbi:glycoprotein endo-alpha-1,2-mannosidase-like isoform X2 [Mobula hypostoma]|uniref:glycoprotein endo-alpha-1,2-mannosidase-like isoform X2 n=1 Tax=Mobula hypostoma TaxID=723540 RepID=UPI002FC3BEEC